MRVSPDRMRRNLELTQGLVFSGQLLLDLAAAGMLREEAYKLVQTHAMKAWEHDGDFRAAIEPIRLSRKYLRPSGASETFSVSRQLANVDRIFQRVFPNRLVYRQTAKSLVPFPPSSFRLYLGRRSGAE